MQALDGEHRRDDRDRPVRQREVEDHDAERAQHARDRGRQHRLDARATPPRARDDRGDHDEARRLRDQHDREDLPRARLEAAEVVGEAPHQRRREREQDAQHRLHPHRPRASLRSHQRLDRVQERDVVGLGGRLAPGARGARSPPRGGRGRRSRAARAARARRRPCRGRGRARPRRTRARRSARQRRVAAERRVDLRQRRAHAGAAALRATPIIASRVTSAASCSSLRPSVPSGRSGSTR